MNFDGKIAVVTGGGSGIGRATVLKMAGLGAKIAIVDINEEAANKVAGEVKEGGGEALVVKTDIANVGPVSVHHRKPRARVTMVLITQTNARRAKDNAPIAEINRRNIMVRSKGDLF